MRHLRHHESGTRDHPLDAHVPDHEAASMRAGLSTKPWGRRDCDRHLECLKTLTPDDVLAQIHAHAPTVLAHERRLVPKDPAMDELRLAYYGNVFDASGYGHAARAYIHALRAAGGQVSVAGLAGRPCTVRDPLVESLVG